MKLLYSPSEVNAIPNLQEVNEVAAGTVERLLETRRSSYTAEAKRLIDACRSLIAETGSADPPVSAILQRAGLSSRALYRLFPSKEDLLLAVLQEGVVATAAFLSERVQQASGAESKLDAWVNAMAERMTTVPPTGRSSLLLQAWHWESLFPSEMAAMRGRLLEPIVPSLRELNPAVRDDVEDAIYDVVVGAVCRALARDETLSSGSVMALADTALAIVRERPAWKGPEC